MGKREISLDTETTGLSPEEGHRLVEIGCVEMRNRIPTGNSYHVYINPERNMPEAAFNVHGLSEEFLSDKPKFAEVADEFLEFIGDSKLVIHNARFDIGFINHELKLLNKDPLPKKQAFCTLIEARSRFPGAANNLDALCRRFNVDNSAREKHGALLDAELLAEMYLELMGGSQVALDLAPNNVVDFKKPEDESDSEDSTTEALAPRAHAASEEELKAHQEFLKKIKDPIWSN